MRFSMNTEDLRSAIEKIFSRPVLNVNRQLSPYSSSYSLEELEIAFLDGGTATVIFKNLGPDAMLQKARAVKPGFLYNPLREIQVYCSVLAQLNAGTPKLYGAVVEETIDRYWLFIEKVTAEQLYECGDIQIWLDAARWLARFHASAACERTRAQSVAPQILDHDKAYYWRWFHRAHDSVGSRLDKMMTGYQRVVDVLVALPRTLIHGEFYASNILIQAQENSLRICPVDWEMAAIGPGLLDVAALASGNWKREERLRIVEAYYSALPDALRPKNLTTAFDCCQLHMALQWLGWSDNWSPYPAHAHDWLNEALRLADEDSMAGLLGKG
jgi:thiamine kinase-like enzyme